MENCEQIISKIMDNCLKSFGPKRYMKRKRRRMRCYIKRRVLELSAQMCPEETIIQSITEEMKKQENTVSKEASTEKMQIGTSEDMAQQDSNLTEVSENEKRRYFSDLDVWVTDSSDTESPPFSSKRKKQVETIESEERHSIYREKAITCLQEINTKLKQKLQDERNSSEKKVCLYGSNYALLENRSRQLAKLKCDTLFRKRTIEMVDSASFSEFFGYIDRVMLETNVTTLDLPDEEISLCRMFCVTENHIFHKMTSSDGEIFVLKGVAQKLRIPVASQHLLVLKEAKILTLVGLHENIIYCHGITWKSEVPYLVTTYESSSKLAEFLSSNKNLRDVTVFSLLNGLCNALIHLQSKQLIHNMLIPENVMLKYVGDYQIPIICGFSFATRYSCTRVFTLEQRKIFQDSHHLPKNVILGREAPSKMSDLYSFRIMARKLIAKLLPSSWKSMMSFQLDLLDGKTLSIEKFQTYLLKKN